MAVVTYAAGTTSLVAKTTRARVRLWAGGGGGGPVTGSGSAGGGGAGGQFVQSRVSLTPGSSYTVVVGLGGSPSWSDRPQVTIRPLPARWSWLRAALGQRS